jgi:ubiquinone/menaquinone biosynthesis C-methylase UbiE
MPLAVADLYDPIQRARGKQYRAESQKLVDLIRPRRPGAATLLDVACGTGQHLAHLRSWFRVEGADLDEGMLARARARLGPDVPLHRSDMVGLDLGHRFDVVTCLFSAIGYLRTVPRLRRAIRTMARHLEPGGLLVVEPWIRPEDWRVGTLHAAFVDEPELKIARMVVSARRGRLSISDMHFLVATPAGVQRLREKLVMGLYADDEYRAAFEAAGLSVEVDPVGLDGRGLYIGRAS